MADYRQYQASQGRGAAKQSQKGNKKKGGLWRVVFWIALVVFIVSALALGAIVFSYLQGQNTYTEIAKTAGFTAPSEDIEAVPLEDMDIDWDALKAQNPDTVGWIYIPGTVINYPLVQTTNNEKYLTADFRGEQGWLANYGTIFLAAENSDDFSDANNLIYGHHMNDGSMFAAIDRMTDSNEFNSHRTIYILTPAGNYELRSFAIDIVEANDPLAQVQFSTKEELTNYIQDKMDRSVVTPDSGRIAASEMDTIFSLVTCNYSIYDGRCVLFASVVDSTVDKAGSSSENDIINKDDMTIIDDATKEIS